MIPINIPVFLSTTFVQKETSQWGYSRVDDPTRLSIEKELAPLEGAKHSLAFSSGSSAIASLLMLFKSNDHVIFHKEIYEGTLRLAEKIFKNFGMKFDLVDLNNLKELKKAVKPSTRLILFESITNPNLETVNIEDVCRLAKKNRILTAVDNTIATPVFERPLKKDADFVIHSLTKFISGHHDVFGGAIMLNNSTLFKKLKFIQQTTGCVLHSLDCHLVSRGVKTLDIRMKRHTENARFIYVFLKNHNKIKKVSFPGKSGLISFIVNENINIESFLKKLSFIKIAQSFGGTETTILHPQSMMAFSFPVGKNFFRLSVGLEVPQIIIKDLSNALM